MNEAVVTVHDVAKACGVSVSTVGRAMTDDPRISEATRARVKKTAQRLGYVQSMAARVMRGGSSRLVGLVLPDISNDFYATSAQALSQCCEEQGYRLVLSISQDNRDTELNHVRELVGAKVAGIIIVPAPDSRPETAALLDGVPHAQLLRNNTHLGADWFGIDDEHCIRDATSHLIALGHRRIAFIGTREKISTATSRLKGFERACADAGINTPTAIKELGEPTVDFGKTASRRLFSLATPPTAIVCGASQITIGVLETVAELGIGIPSAVSVVGFGDPVWAKLWAPGLTTIRFPIEELATSCGLWFLHRLKKKGSAHAAHSVVTSSTLVVRGSTSAPPNPAQPTTSFLQATPHRPRRSKGPRAANERA
jgi:DNA-binding LacI/PurR family transcriptional regulator